jgi:anti-sigma factor RsiW
MKREKARALLPDYLNGRLRGRGKERLEALLHTDEELRREAEAMRREFALLRESLSDPQESARLDSISRRVMAHISEDPAVTDSAPAAAWVPALSAAAALIGFAAVLLLLQPTHRVSVDVQSLEEPAITASTEQITGTGEQPDEGMFTAVTEQETGHAQTAVGAPQELSTSSEPRSINLSFATNDPKVKIYWTFSRDFDPNLIGE